MKHKQNGEEVLGRCDSDHRASRVRTYVDVLRESLPKETNLLIERQKVGVRGDEEQ